MFALADEGPATEAFESRCRIETAESPTAAVRSIDSDTDCLVVDAETFRAIEADGTVASLSVPVVVFTADADPKLAQTIARLDGCDIVYRDAVEVSTAEPASELDRLRDRIDAACGEQTQPASEQPDGNLEEIVLETAGNLMGAAPDEVDTKIEWGLGSIAETLGASRSAVYEHEGDRLVMTHEWHAPDHESVTHETVRTEAFPGFESNLSQFESFRTAAGGEPGSSTKGGARARLGYNSAGVFIAVPVVIDWTLRRVLVVEGVPHEILSERTNDRLRTAGELIGQTLRRNDRRREIEQQNERLERFASVIGHDLQNPLNVIIGYTELARETSDFEAIDRIEAAADRMETILEDLQTLTREAKDLGDREFIAISEVVERACRTVETEDVTVDIDEIGSVEADSSRLRQAFENLLRNAVEHSGSDVTVRIERIDDGFAVTDDGPGFSPADRGHVFEEGYTGDNGTGLGLAIVRTVIEAHGWTIEATDGDDGGARFEIRGIEFDN
jgi:signal transduction histidine kinase